MRITLLIVIIAGLVAAVAIPAGRGKSAAAWAPASHAVPGSQAVPDSQADPAPNTVEAVPRGTYGSGRIGPWTNLSRAISSPGQIRQVLAADGIFMFGDSIAVQDGESLARHLLAATGDSIAMHNWSGEPTSAAVDALEQWKRDYGLPSRILMAVNSNDIFAPFAFAEQVERVMRIVGPNRTVYWVNAQVARTKQPSEVQVADQRNSAWLNLQLADAERRNPNLRIIHWAEFLAADPDRLETYLRDGLHTSVPRGQNARNELIVQAIRG
ncbi:hypothetical protein GCM10009789_57500 [Kribbella sancticallisti]|uniref:SGNH hydrolase-type esterase domain-containing protein n=1 Tax=Kribbella sancticallisti TaxID=460087 RepID=A0ABN2E633_9ACTN